MLVQRRKRLDLQLQFLRHSLHNQPGILNRLGDFS